MTDIKRRKVLKTASVATVAAGAWHKPVLNSVVTPAHAQTSAVAPLMGAGASSSTPFLNASNTINNSNNSFAEKAIDALISPANAGLGPDVDSCLAFLDDNTHCVSLMFPDGDNRDGMVNVTVNGPELYYGLQCIYFAYSVEGLVYSYAGSLQINDSQTVQMANGVFEVNLGNVIINGTVNDAFDNANGTMLYDGPDLSLEFDNNGYCEQDNTVDAYWAAEIGEPGGSCTVGGGAAADNGINIVVNGQCPIDPQE